MTARLRGVVLIWVFASAPAIVALRRLPVDAAALWWFAGVTLVLAVLAEWAPRWVAAVTAIAAFQLVVRAGPPVGDHWVWLVAGVALWAVALGRTSVGIRGRRASPDAVHVLAVPLAAAATCLLVGTALVAPAVATLAAVLGWGVIAFGPPSLVRRAEAMGRSIGIASNRASNGRSLVGGLAVVALVPVRVVAALLGLALWIVLVTVWVGQRLVGYDPLRSRSGGRSRWLDRRVAPSAARLGGGWAPERLAAQRAHRVVAVVATAAVWALAGLVGVSAYAVSSASTSDGSAPPECPVSCEVFADTPGWHQLWEDTDAFTSHPVYDASTGFRFDDIATTSVNVRAGERAGWAPPACVCRPVRVWWYGGSTAFGFWQRDAQSLPSQVARAALRRGLTLDVHNFAMPGWVIGQEVRDFGNRLVATPPAQRPDVVIFFDGANDVVAQNERNRDRRGSDESEPMIRESTLDTVMRTGRLPGPDTPPRPATDPSRLSDVEVADHAVRRYLRNTELARLMTDGTEITPIFVWQPVAAFSPPEASGQPALAGRAMWRAEMDAASKRLPPSVVDLTRAFTDVRTPVWGDALHTNERGAELMAERLVDEVLEQLRAASRR